jgi:hypothetical protein
LLVYRAELDLRPALADAYRALRELATDATPGDLQQALRGTGRHPRTPEVCARLVAILVELGLIEFNLEPPAGRVLQAKQRSLAESPLFAACTRRLAAVEHALGAEIHPRTAAQAA